MKKLEFGPEVHDAMPLKDINIYFSSRANFFVQFWSGAFW